MKSNILQLFSKKTILLLLLSPLFFSVHAQVIPDDDGDKAFTVVQQMPKFRGSLSDYLVANIKYPETERKAGISGKVFITFVVEKDGSVSGVKLLRGVSNGPGLNAEGLRVVQIMPKWDPGMQDGKPVRVQFNLPISFELK